MRYTEDVNIKPRHDLSLGVPRGLGSRLGKRVLQWTSRDLESRAPVVGAGEDPIAGRRFGSSS